MTSQRRDAESLKEALEEALEKHSENEVVGAATQKNASCGHAA